MNIGKIGLAGEDIAKRHLKKQGYKILSQNYQTRFGEIDIIAQNKEYIVFCEVKTRKPDSIVSGREAVDFRKQNRIVKTALDYISKFDVQLQPRFDVIEVIAEGKKAIVEHIENAFEVSSY